MRFLHLPPILPVCALLVSIALSDTTVHPHCGTALAAQLKRVKTSNGGALQVQTLPISGRTFKTTHFAIHYTLAPTVHRPRFVTADSALLRQINLIRKGVFASTSQRDSAINAGFADSIAPAYVKRVAVYFERAYSYYSDSLGMAMPQGGTSSTVFSGPDDGDLFTVDVVDMGTANTAYAEEYFGVTNEPPVSILFENDFLYHASADTGGVVSGLPFISYLNGQVLHNYSVDWDMGIKVTASHEFYHAVQYTYTGLPDAGFHAWYELSAVGMEERLAPEVNDYFQYLPSVLQHHESVSLLTPPSIENYGNGIFHQYLTRTFGKAFDVKVWSNLRDNGGDLPSALKAMTTSFGAKWDSVYSSYVAAVAVAGRAGAAATCTDTTSIIFTRDLRCWPTPSYDTLPALSKSKVLTVNPMTYRLLKPGVWGTQGVVSSTNLIGAQLVAGHTPNYNAVPVSLAGNGFTFFSTADGSILDLSLPNSAFTGNDLVIVSSRPQNIGIATVPNPVSLSNSAVFFFPPSSVTGRQTIPVVSESGLHIADLPFDSSAGFWSWNLKNKQGAMVPPGAYYYQFPGQTPKTLLVLPP